MRKSPKERRNQYVQAQRITTAEAAIAVKAQPAMTFSANTSGLYIYKLKSRIRHCVSRRGIERRQIMKLEVKKKIVVQVYPGRKFGTVIGSNDGLIGILQDNGEYIDVPQERLRIISEEVEKDGKDKSHIK